MIIIMDNQKRKTKIKEMFNVVIHTRELVKIELTTYWCRIIIMLNVLCSVYNDSLIKTLS